MPSEVSFEQLGLGKPLERAAKDLGYEIPTPVQKAAIPFLMAKHDVLAQAQTGTGKTAAFALPVLSHLDLSLKKTQVLVLAPTRELAIQVAEAFQTYAKYLEGFHVAPIYGGQDYRTQLRALKRGVHVVVGTPGRVMDHLRRGTLELDALKTLVLDEADEMLKMGFIDDIEWILEQIPGEHQTALFSATLPQAIQKISQRYLKQPKKVCIKTATATVSTIEQGFVRVHQNQKIEALTRFLEIEVTQGILVFVRTKNISAELAERLQARGYAAAALNGDMSQSLREQVIGRLRKGTLDIVVATDVAARGIDVERVTHVINYDVPHDVESYIHRIGRTGRAGRQGKAILFVTPREGRLLHAIERGTNQSIQQWAPPSLALMREKRSQQLTERLQVVLENPKLMAYHGKHIEAMMEATEADAARLATALVALMEEADPLPTRELDDPASGRGHERGGRSDRRDRHDRGGRGDRRDRAPRGERVEGDRRDRAPRGERVEGDRGGRGAQRRAASGAGGRPKRGSNASSGRGAAWISEDASDSRRPHDKREARHHDRDRAEGGKHKKRREGREFAWDASEDRGRGPGVAPKRAYAKPDGAAKQGRSFKKKDKAGFSSKPGAASSKQAKRPTLREHKTYGMAHGVSRCHR